jgi:2-(1,2-epoxy-1,2-dihydrophenyl)acetyl-CoA isomerase
MASTEIVLERRSQALIIKFNRPDHANALTMDMANQLFNILKATTTDRSVRAVLLVGSGGQYMSGLDMSFYAGDVNDALDRANQLILPYHSCIREMQTMDKPVISAVEGVVTGAGLSFMLASDLVIAASDTIFNCGFTKFGLTPDGACSYFLPRKIGASKAIELMMLSRDFNVEEARHYGLVHRVYDVVDDHHLHDFAASWLDEIAAGPTKAYGAVKKLAMASFEHDIVRHLGLEHTYFGASSRSFDFREAVKAYFAERAANFTGT